ncbi:hypothetical protein F4824DRAFT_464651 [Ustulina deusta]|nr:hypothetical protein F4824DRAFT_464651 [Ustulina deusta]
MLPQLPAFNSVSPTYLHYKPKTLILHLHFFVIFSKIAATMSGSGGFYKYPCKYRYTQECPHWVYVNHTACSECSAQGRDNVVHLPGQLHIPHAIGDPAEVLYGDDCLPSVGT